MKELNVPMSIRECGVDEETFLKALPGLSERAFEDQCTTANPRYPLVSELEEIYPCASGIPKEDLQRITEAFYMVDKSRSRKQHGAGLGLAICELIAQLHQTVLRFESAPGEGTRVFLSLVPVAKEEKNEEV